MPYAMTPALPEIQPCASCGGPPINFLSITHNFALICQACRIHTRAKHESEGSAIGEWNEMQRVQTALLHDEGFQ